MQPPCAPGRRNSGRPQRQQPWAHRWVWPAVAPRTWQMLRQHRRLSHRCGVVLRPRSPARPRRACFPVLAADRVIRTQCLRKGT
jgi:hypothetical protein